MGDGLPAGDCEGIRWCACLAGVSRLGVRCCADSSGPRASANGSRPELAEALKNWRWTEPLHTCTSLQLCLWLWLRTVSECQAWKHHGWRNCWLGSSNFGQSDLQPRSEISMKMAIVATASW